MALKCVFYPFFLAEIALKRLCYLFFLAIPGQASGPPPWLLFLFSCGPGKNSSRRTGARYTHEQPMFTVMFLAKDGQDGFSVGRNFRIVMKEK